VLANAGAVWLDAECEAIGQCDAIQSSFHRIVVGFDRSSRKSRHMPRCSNSHRIDKRGDSHIGERGPQRHFCRTSENCWRFRNKFVGPKSVNRLGSAQVRLDGEVGRRLDRSAVKF
jgi:hypothetical protein